MKIDLNKCNKGDILLCRTGAILEYISPTKEENYYDHKIKYLFIPNYEYDAKNLGEGTRTNDGYVFRNKRLDTDHDIVAIIPKLLFKRIFNIKQDKYSLNTVLEFVEYINLHYRDLEHTKIIKNVKDTKELFKFYLKENEYNSN